MASIAGTSAPVRSLAPDRLEQAMAIAALVLLGCVVIAVTKGAADLPRVPAFVLLHLATITTALALTPVMLLRRRGDRTHRRLGTVWVLAMFATAALSFGIRTNQWGGFSPIHILSVWTVIQVPIIWWTARNHKIDRHRSAVRGMVFGALLIAGFFTFPFDRMLGRWLFS
ncbi:DUF2306 domain-containing protein [Blastomonas sp.]|uniref:DUF2306 domain-containing protein n=1 Tax=Blastomonas sp. TaxID=1909299 RepID=UPI00260D2BA7|nr:DUF2306 domain-containing protein [Blastomonas sp.]MDM7955480.1 DUF2306 domain-containing protein [Blastomonas sp.]